MRKSEGQKTPEKEIVKQKYCGSVTIPFAQEKNDVVQFQFVALAHNMELAGIPAIFPMTSM